MSDKRVKIITNVINEEVFVEVDRGVYNLRPGESLHNVVVKNIETVRPYVKMVEDLTEIIPH